MAYFNAGRSKKLTFRSSTNILPLRSKLTLQWRRVITLEKSTTSAFSSRPTRPEVYFKYLEKTQTHRFQFTYDWFLIHECDIFLPCHIPTKAFKVKPFWIEIHRVWSFTQTCFVKLLLIHRSFVNFYAWVSKFEVASVELLNHRTPPGVKTKNLTLLKTSQRFFL
jgi:hypothetical protein